MTPQLSSCIFMGAPQPHRSPCAGHCLPFLVALQPEDAGILCKQSDWAPPPRTPPSLSVIPEVKALDDQSHSQPSAPPLCTSHTAVSALASSLSHKPGTHSSASRPRMCPPLQQSSPDIHVAGSPTSQTSPDLRVPFQVAIPAPLLRCFPGSPWHLCSKGLPSSLIHPFLS